MSCLSSRTSRHGLAVLIASALVLALAACATPMQKIPPYVAPVSGPTAKLVIRGQIAPTDAAYGIYAFGDADHCGAPSLVGAGNNAHHPATTQLAADRIATIDFALIKADKRFCRLRWSFTPEPGRTYLVQGTSTPTGCRAGIFNATDPDRVVPEPTLLRRDVPGNTCVSLSQARLAAGAPGATDRSGEAVLNPRATTDDLKELMP